MKSRGAWNLVRVALLRWAREGSGFRSRAQQLAVKFVKSLHGRRSRRRRLDSSYAALRRGERQFSFGSTPVARRPAPLRLKLPRIPCIGDPRVDFDFRSTDEDDDYTMESREYGSSDHSGFFEESSATDDYGGDEIDQKAEQFIASFYEQIKLQRQISYLQRHSELLSISTSPS
ncbi:unnamed protein product [Cuscuta campestris]|uniref:Cotton fiber protein n=1 Tax=Cuscuta campestris TaxID=132261 RepID=A0A484LQD1_9ASTE|nr:unnamed protein product [Cuscuta campestris]